MCTAEMDSLREPNAQRSVHEKARCLNTVVRDTNDLSLCAAVSDGRSSEAQIPCCEGQHFSIQAFAPAAKTCV